MPKQHAAPVSRKRVVPSTNDGLFSLDIIGGGTDVTSTNCALRKNQTELLARGTRDFIVSYRNELLANRRWIVPEDWDSSWRKGQGTIWTPDALLNCETWILPEYFSPDSVNDSICIMANNRIGFDPDDTELGAGGFEQQASVNMPSLERDVSYRNYQRMSFDGAGPLNGDRMRGESTGMWDVDTKDFICYIACTGYGAADEIQSVVAKKNKADFAFQIDHSGSNKDFVYNMGSNELVITGAASSAVGLLIAGFGRDAGIQFLRAPLTSSLPVQAGSQDLTAFNTAAKPYLGTMQGSDPDFGGTVYEIIFINNQKNLIVDNVTNANILKIEGYLAWKYGVETELPSDHTFRYSPPRKDEKIKIVTL